MITDMIKIQLYRKLRKHRPPFERRLILCKSIQNIPANEVKLQGSQGSQAGLHTVKNAKGRIDNAKNVVASIRSRRRR